MTDNKNIQKPKSKFGLRAYKNYVEKIEEYVVPEKDQTIGYQEFSKFASLKKIIIHNDVWQIDSSAFDGIDFNYAYFSQKDGSLILAKDAPFDMSKYYNVIDLKKTFNVIDNFSYNDLLVGSMLRNVDAYKPFVKVVENLNKIKFHVPYQFLVNLYAWELLLDFAYNADLRHFKNEIKDYGDWEDYQIFRIAYILGCFRTENMIGKNQQKTETTLGQKASHLLARMLKANSIDVDDFLAKIYHLRVNVLIHQSFIKFISTKGDRGEFQNIQDIMELCDKYPNFLNKIVATFNEVENCRKTVDEYLRLPVKLSWKDAMEKYYNARLYIDVTPEVKDIAKLFYQKGLKQNSFNKACEVREKAIANKMKPHILSKHIIEEKCENQIEDIKNQTLFEIQSASDNLKNVFKEQFTYEMLNKYDPRNAIIGLYCDCCAVLDSYFYGAQITEAVMTEDNLQNLVIKNSNDEIIAKGSMYVDKNYGYVVINEFDVDSRYTESQSLNKILQYDQMQSDQKQIFDAFMRGIRAFVKQYDIENPHNVINFVSVGLGHNKLTKYCKQYDMAEDTFWVPDKYNFLDALDSQVILYDRKKELGLEEEIL